MLLQSLRVERGLHSSLQITRGLLSVIVKVLKPDKSINPCKAKHNAAKNSIHAVESAVTPVTTGFSLPEFFLTFQPV